MFLRMSISFRLGFLREAKRALSSVSCGNGNCDLSNGLLRNTLRGQWVTAGLVLQHGLHPGFIDLNRNRKCKAGFDEIEAQRRHATGLT